VTRVTFLFGSSVHNGLEGEGGKTMPRDDRNILDVLKAELNYVKKGGYGRSPREPWRAQLVFEDSPTCMNYDSKENRAPCAECLLMQFVPDDKRRERVPCRHIPLTSGDSVLHLYRGGTEQEIEEALAIWLENEIAKLESMETPGLASTQLNQNTAAESLV
jgi:hypothetical protein